MRRRAFIAGLGSAAAWPLAVWAQQGDRARRIGVLMWGDENDPVLKTFTSAFVQALADLGWTDGRKVRMDLRWHGGDINRIRALAQELVGLQPDIILSSSTPSTVALQRETRTIPIVFADVAGPVASGIVSRLDRPTGNITGFAIFEASLRGKWLEVLSEVAPGLTRAVIPARPYCTRTPLYSTIRQRCLPRLSYSSSTRQPGSSETQVPACGVSGSPRFAIRTPLSMRYRPVRSP
jgi:putative ABC transport system substrate-binding protein